MAEWRQNPLLLYNEAALTTLTPKKRRTHMSRIILFVLLLAAAPVQAECYADFKAKQDNPLKLAYGVSQVSDAACGDTGAARAELAGRLQAAGWTLLKILSTFGPEGLGERQSSAGEFFLRF
jgi:hypothetical protein